MKVHRLDRAIARLRTAGASARPAGLEKCMQHNVPRTIVDVLRTPVASEQLVLIIKRTNPRLDAAEDQLQGLRDFVAALDDREAAVRAMKVPRGAKRERAEYLAAMRAYRIGLDAYGDATQPGWTRRTPSSSGWPRATASA